MPTPSQMYFALGQTYAREAARAHEKALQNLLIYQDTDVNLNERRQARDVALIYQREACERYAISRLLNGIDEELFSC